MLLFVLILVVYSYFNLSIILLGILNFTPKHNRTKSKEKLNLSTSPNRTMVLSDQVSESKIEIK